MKLIKLKNNKYKILLDNIEIVTYEDVIIDNNLLYKKSIDDTMYNKIVKDTLFYDVYNKCIKLLSSKRKSEYEVIEYLNKFELSSSDNNKIINKLKSINLINDYEYCKSYINDKLLFSSDGLSKIKKDLINKHISLSIINNEINNINREDINSKIEKMVLKKIRTNKKYSNNYLKKKIIYDMKMDGYDINIVEDILNNNLENDDDILNQEYNKLYNKYCLKYNSNELKNKLIQKLLLKGFSIEKINNVIEKNRV